MWLSAFPCTFMVSRSRAKVSPAGSAWSPVPVISSMAGSGLSGAAWVSIGASSVTVRPRRTSAAAASTRSGVR